jgi:hypothetical protein
MKIGGIDMPIVQEDFGSNLEHECALAIEDWNSRMFKLGVGIPHDRQVLVFEMMCVVAHRTVMGLYEENGNDKDRDDPSEEPCS